MAQRGSRNTEVWYPRARIKAELSVGRNDLLDRALDLLCDAGRTVEILREEHRLEERPDLVIVGTEPTRQFQIYFLRHFVIAEKAVELPGDKPCRCVLLQNDIDGVVAIEIPTLAEKRLLAFVVNTGVINELRSLDEALSPGPLVAAREALLVQRPSGQGARQLSNVVFGVVPDPHREQFHDFTCEILVGMPLGIGAVVEPDQHLRILTHRDK